jgi:hypothetical protein
MQKTAFSFLFFLLAGPLLAQRSAEWLPPNHLFQPILLDPLEAQASGSLVKRWEDGKAVNGLFSPFSIGFRKPLVRWTRDETHASELAFDIGAFTQFEMFTDDRGVYRRYMYNVDYKVSLSYALRRGRGAWRFRFYHLSSHLGDDYVIQQRLSSAYPDANNYEQFDALYATQRGGWRLYGGGGFVLSAAASRKRPYVQAGTLYKSGGETLRFVAGADLRLLAQTEYTPNVKAAIGLEVGKVENRPLAFLLEGYAGKLPYSTYEERRTAWVGAGVYLNPF